MTRAHVLHHLIGVENIIADLLAPLGFNHVPTYFSHILELPLMHDCQQLSLDQVQGTCLRSITSLLVALLLVNRATVMPICFCDQTGLVV